jgi:autotransporter-associated beta strand protein
VNNSGAITTEGGQVLMQAAAISDAVASISHTGNINTTGTQGGAVTLRADGGIIQVNGSIKANSTDANRVGGDIIIGRNEATGVLAKATDVSGATLESQGGFIETSGMQLAAEGIQVKAKDWLLDPVDIEINNAGTGTQASYSQISNATVNAALNAGTTVTIQTTGSGSTSLTPSPAWSGTGGRILVSGALSKTVNKVATLNLTADTQIDVNNSISNSAGTLTVALNAPTINSNSSGTISGVNLTLNNTSSGTMTGIISNSTPTGSLTKNGTGSISLTGANTYTGNTSVKAGTLQATQMGSFKSASLAIDAGSIFEANTTVTALNTSNTTVSGAGTFKKTGAGSLILTGFNSITAMIFDTTFTGLIDIKEGILQNDGTRGNLQSNQGNINIEAGASLDIRNQSVRIKGLSGAGTIIDTWPLTPAPTVELGFGTTANDVYTFTGIIGTSSSKPFNLAKTGFGTQILSGNNLYQGSTTVWDGTLQIGNGGNGTLGIGSVALKNNAHLKFLRNSDTSISNTITGVSNSDVFINITNNSGATAHLTINNNISLETGTVTLNADGNVSLPSLISTNNTSNSAVVINAGQALNAGDSSGGNVLAKADTKITVGQGGRATLYTGSIAGSSNVTTLIGSGTGRFRYASDETKNGYNTTTASLGTGLYAIYREAPIIEFSANSVTNLVYNGSSQTGNQGVTQTAGSLKNGDSSFMLTGTNSYSYTQNGAVAEPKNAGNYTITASGQTSDLGYLVSYKSGTLSISKKNVSLDSISAANKTYDGNESASITSGVISGTVGNETLNISGSGSFSDKNAASSKTVTVLDVSSLTKSNGNNGGDWSNYNLNTSGSKFTTANIEKASLTITASTETKTYDGSTSSSIAARVSGLVSGDSVRATQSFASKNALGVNGSTLQVNLDYEVIDGNNGKNYVVQLATAAGTVTPKILTPTFAEPIKKMDGNTQAFLEGIPSFFGVLSTDNVTISQSATYDTPTAGKEKIVTVRNITLSGKDSGNYGLKSSTTTIKGTIIAVPPIAVPSVILPTQSSPSSGRVGNGVIANATIGNGNPFQLATVPVALEDVCSSTNLEKCHCEETALNKDISLCYQPK